MDSASVIIDNITANGGRHMTIDLECGLTLRNHFIRNEQNDQQKIQLDNAFKEFLIAKEIEGLRERTLQDHNAHFQYFKDYLERSSIDIIFVHEVSVAICRGYIAFMKNKKIKWDNHKVLNGKYVDKGLSPVTINIRVRSLKAQFNFYLSEGYIKDDPWKRVPLMKTDESVINSFSKDDLIRILKAPNPSTFVGYRNLTLMYTLLDTGLRCSELVSLNECNVDLENRIIYVGAKRSKPRTGRPVPISEKTVDLITTLLKENSILKVRDPAIFISVSGRRLDTSDIRRIFKDYGKEAGINNVRVSPHTMRHTFAKHFILNGGDPFTLQSILGHSDISMTERYILMKIDDLKQQHDKFSPINN
jgi:integrase/recombinase XerD